MRMFKNNWVNFLVFVLVSMLLFFVHNKIRSPSVVELRNDPLFAYHEFAQGALHRYLRAQELFKSSNYSAIPGNNRTTTPHQYCDNFRNLFYGRDHENNLLMLITREFADAFTPPTPGAPAREPATETGIPWGGILFSEWPSWNPDDEHATLTAYVAMKDGGLIKLLTIDSRTPMTVTRF